MIKNHSNNKVRESPVKQIARGNVWQEWYTPVNNKIIKSWYVTTKNEQVCKKGEYTTSTATAVKHKTC